MCESCETMRTPNLIRGIRVLCWLAILSSLLVVIGLILHCGRVRHSGAPRAARDALTQVMRRAASSVVEKYERAHLQDMSYNIVGMGDGIKGAGNVRVTFFFETTHNVTHIGGGFAVTIDGRFQTVQSVDLTQ